MFEKLSQTIEKNKKILLIGGKTHEINSGCEYYVVERSHIFR